MNTGVSKTDRPLVLALDTSSKTTSMAIARGGRVIESVVSLEAEVRSEKLWDDVESLVARVGAGVGDIELFGVCVGPGGFTGLRVGIAAVKGYATATGKPVVGVTALEAAAFEAKGASLVCAMVNAYKSDVYWQLFSFDEEGAIAAESEPAVSTMIEAIERVSHIDEIIFAGDGAAKAAEIIERMGGERFSGEASRERRGWRVIQASEAVALSVARLAFKKYASGDSETAESLRACYVRPAEAEIKLSLGLLGSKIRRSLERQ